MKNYKFIFIFFIILMIGIGCDSNVQPLKNALPTSIVNKQKIAIDKKIDGLNTKWLNYKNDEIGVEMQYPDYFRVEVTTSSIALHLKEEIVPRIEISKYSKQYFDRVTSVKNEDISDGYGYRTSTTIGNVLGQLYMINFEGVNEYILLPSKLIVITLTSSQALCDEHKEYVDCTDTIKILGSIGFF